MPAARRPETAGVVLWRSGDHGGQPEVGLLDTAGGPGLPTRPAGRGPGGAVTAAVALARLLVPAPGPLGPRLLSGKARTRRRVFWPVEVHGPSPDPDGREERDGLRWVPADEAADAVASGADRRVLRAFLADPSPRRPVVIVRHARAGKRGGWAGPDEERPLDRRGRAQAAALVEVLAGYQVERIHSSAARRCRETVTPLAEAVDIAIDEDRLLGEVAALDDPASASARLVELVQRPGRAVICGQRKSLDIALPGLLEALGVTGSVAVPGKGGLLVLHVPREGGAEALVEGVQPLA